MLLLLRAPALAWAYSPHTYTHTYTKRGIKIYLWRGLVRNR